MSEIKLTKNELRAQQGRLTQLLKYLPTLQLKKAMLQSEIEDARQEIAAFESAYSKAYTKAEGSAALLSQKTSINVPDAVTIEKVHKRHENIAGIDVPYFEKVDFKPLNYSLFDTPPWVDGVINELRLVTESKIKVLIAEEKKSALEKELREVSIRVNLFEKILIPRAQLNIKKIKVFLGDQELAAVSQAKVAKGKIEANKLAMLKKKEVFHAI